MRSRFVTDVEPIRLRLADVYVRAHETLVAQKNPLPTAEALAESEARLKTAIDEDAWIDIKPQLNAGEFRAAQTRLMRRDPAPGQAPTIDYDKVGFTKAAAYVIGWNLIDADGRPVPIPIGDEEPEVSDRERLMRRLDQTTFEEILAAIDAHEAAVDRAKNRSGGTSFAAISPSRD